MFYCASFTSEPISNYVGSLTICLNRFSHMRINCAVYLYDVQQVAGNFVVRQNQAAPLYVPLNRYHLFTSPQT